MEMTTKTSLLQIIAFLVIAILLVLGITAGAAKAESGYVIIDGKPQIVTIGPGNVSDGKGNMNVYHDGMMYDKKRPDEC